MRAEDAFYGVTTFGLAWLDASPFVRLVRRSMAVSYVDRRKAAILGDGARAFPYAEVLARMVTDFADKAREDGQHPVVFLIQTRDPADPDLLGTLGPVLRGYEIPYLATAEHVNPRDPTAFIGDGHYTKANDALFAEIFMSQYNSLPAPR